MKKTLKKIVASALAVTLALGACGSLVACGGDSTPVDNTPDVDIAEYTETSAKLYDEVLGEFKEYYDKALAAESISERYALMAIAEAKMLESGVFLPSTTRGGNYAISRAVPHTGTNVLWGNDSDKLHYILVTTTPVRSEDRTHLNGVWADATSGDDYLAKAKAYLTEKGYTLKDTYLTTYTSDPTTWDVLATDRQPNSLPVVQTYDGLIEYDVKGVMQPAMATEIPEEVKNADGTVSYTFKIRSGQQWVNSQGTKVADFKASDFATGFQHMLDAKGGLEWLIDGLIVGAHEYLESADKDFSTVGVKADDDEMTVTYTLTESTPYFLTMLGYNIFAPLSKEFYESQGGKFGSEYNPTADGYNYGKAFDRIAFCGPYRISEHTASNTINYTANDSWWNKDAAHSRGVSTIRMSFVGNRTANDRYKDMKEGTLDGIVVTTDILNTVKNDMLSGSSEDSWFSEYHYVTSTDATTFNIFLNINRNFYSNEDGKAVSPQSVAERARTQAAMKNQDFRLAVFFAFDRVNYNALVTGEELAARSLRNSYTPGNFVSLVEDTTVKINGTDKTYEAGTMYGEIMQAQFDADKFPVTVWKEIDGEMSSDGYDGWFNVDGAKAYLEKAIVALQADGVTVDADHPIQIDYPYWSGQQYYVTRANVVKQNLEKNLDNKVKVNLVECVQSSEWEDAAFNPENGYQMNYDMQDLSGWGPDYGDPSSYLDTLVGNFGTMIRMIGIY